MLSHLYNQAKDIRGKDYDEIKHHFLGTLPCRYPIMDSRDLEFRLDDCIATVMSFIQYKDKECHNFVDTIQYDNPDATKKINSFLKGLSKYLSFDIGYWFK